MNKTDSKKKSTYQAPVIQSSRADELKNRTVEVNACFSFFQGKFPPDFPPQTQEEDGVTY